MNDEYTCQMNCTLAIDVVVRASSMQEAETMAEKLAEKVGEQLTIDCGNLDSRVIEVCTGDIDVTKGCVYHAD